VGEVELIVTISTTLQEHVGALQDSAERFHVGGSSSQTNGNGYPIGQLQSSARRRLV
jgi:hypothetical protein